MGGRITGEQAGYGPRSRSPVRISLPLWECGYPLGTWGKDLTQSIRTRLEAYMARWEDYRTTSIVP